MTNGLRSRASLNFSLRSLAPGHLPVEVLHFHLLCSLHHVRLFGIASAPLGVKTPWHDLVKQAFLALPTQTLRRLGYETNVDGVRRAQRRMEALFDHDNERLIQQLTIWKYIV